MNAAEVQAGALAGPQRLYARDHWRTCIVNEAARAFGFKPAQFEDVLVQNKHTLGGSLRTLLDEMEAQENLHGRTTRMQLVCINRCTEIARAFAHLRHKDAQPLPPVPRETTSSLDF